MTDKIKKILFKIANWICLVAMVVIVVVLLIVVIGRYFFNYTPSWSEETALFMLTWVGLFSASIAEYRGSHVRVQFIDKAFPPKVLRVFGIIRWFLKVAFFTLMIFYGVKIFATTKQRFGAINLSYRWQVLPGLFTGVFCLIFTLLNAKTVFTDKHERDVEKDLEELMNG